MSRGIHRITHKLTTARVVTFPDYNLPFYFYTDVSLVAIRAIPVQIRDNREHFIA